MILLSRPGFLFFLGFGLRRAMKIPALPGVIEAARVDGQQDHDAQDHGHCHRARQVDQQGPPGVGGADVHGDGQERRR
jgi:hypothetical protein